jgi:hypothetical protein
MIPVHAALRRAAAAASLGLLVSLLFIPTAFAARQKAALSPIDVSGDNNAAIKGGALERAIVEKLSDRFDILLLAPENGSEAESVERRARKLGTPYLLEGSVIRIGKSVSLELRVTPNESSSIGKTVVASARDDAGDAPVPKDALPPIYRRLITEATSNIKLRFFGDDRVAGGARINGLAGTLTRSASFPGNPVSVAVGDTDKDGKRELVVGFPNEIIVYRIDGDEILEKSRIPDAGPGIVRIDASDIDRNGIAEIISVRFTGGKALSDIWAYDGKAYRRRVGGLPWFLTPSNLPDERGVLAGQESDPESFFKGPLFRLAFDRYGEGEIPDKRALIPLPAGTGIFEWSPLRYRNEQRFAAFGKDGIPILFDSAGKRLGTASDPLRGVDVGMGAFSATATGEQTAYPMPPRLFAIDLNGDGTDELVAVNNLLTPGIFFESVKVQSGAEVLAFSQEAGGGLKLAWRTPQTVFGVRDAFMLDDEAKQARRVGLLVREKGKLLEGQSEWRIVWMR